MRRRTPPTTLFALMLSVAALVASPAYACSPPSGPDWQIVLKRQQRAAKATADVVVVGRYVRTVTNKVERKLVYPNRVLRGEVRRSYRIPNPVSTCDVYPPENMSIKLYLKRIDGGFYVAAFEKIR